MSGALATEKAALRKTARTRRRDAALRTDPSPAQALLLEILRPGAGRVLAGYIPVRDEIDPRPVMSALCADRPVCVPVVRGKGLPLEFLEWTPDAVLGVGNFGVPVPLGGARLQPVDLIVPMLAFDRSGLRLGYGGGYYDRTLAALRAEGEVRALGFAFSAQEFAVLPAEPTDMRLDAIVTEAGRILPGPDAASAPPLASI